MSKPKDVLVVGGGVAGLVSSCIFSSFGAHVKMFECGKLGGEFLAGGLKYIHRTDNMTGLFIDLGLVFSNYSVKGGILNRGVVERYPELFQRMDKYKVAQIQMDHFRKTRMMEPGSHYKTAMNDPANSISKGAIRLDFVDMVNRLAARLKRDGGEIVREKVIKVLGENSLMTDKGRRYAFDYLIFTVPLWIIKRLVDFYIPDAMAMNLNLIDVVPKNDRYAGWDYVYTPYTPGDAIHRFSVDGVCYVCELNGELAPRMVDVVSDLNFIFGAGYVIKKITRGLKGHLHPMGEKIQWPENMAPLGRFAEWNSRGTVDKILENAIELAEKWL